MKSQTEYVKPVCVSSVRNQIAVYRKFKKLMEERIELGLEASRIMMKGEEKGSGQERSRHSQVKHMASNFWLCVDSADSMLIIVSEF